jgi:hypothetical protein
MTAYLGRVVRAVLPTVSASSAGGFWNPVMAQYYQQAGTWPSGSGADPYFPYVTALLNGDGTNGAQNNTFLDSSTNNFTITRNGNTTQGSATPYVGPGNWSNYFDGNGDYLSFSSNSALAMSTGDFTIEGWANFGALNNKGIFQLATTAFPAAVSGLAVSYDSANNLWGVYYGGSATAVYRGTAITTNTWYHFALVRASGALTLYINGTAYLVTASDATNYTGTALIVGGYYSTSYLMNGYISNFRITNGRAIYTTSFTPLTTPLIATTQTVLLTCNNNGFIDQSAANNTITRNGDTLVSKFSPFTLYQTTPASYSGYFDGTGDYLSIASNAVFGFGTGDFTVEYWIYATSWASGPTIVDLRAAAGNSGFSDYYSTGGAPNMYWYNTTVLTSSVVVPLNTWTHVAYTRASGTIKIFVNGVLGASGSSSSDLQASVPCKIGSTFVPSNYLTGSLSNLRIIKGQALYTSAFTPSTSPLTTTSQGATAANVSLLTCQSTTFIDNSTNALTITANGDARPRTANPFTDTVTGPTPYSTATYGGSAYFDGNGDYLTTPSNTGFAWGTGNFTVELWFSTPSAFSVSRTNIAGTMSSGGGLFAPTNTNMNWNSFGVGDIITAAFVPSPGAWYHLAYSRSGTTGRLFINGALLVSGTDSTNYTATTFSVGFNAVQYLNAYVANLRVIKGSAVYTAPFVPPAAPVTAISGTQLLLNATNGGIIDAAAIANYETVGNAQVSTSVVKYGTGSIAFDGTGDYLVPWNSTTWAFGTGDWTIECWVYFNSVASTQFVFDTRANATSNSGVALNLSATAFPVITVNNATLFTSSTAIAATTWTHVALVKSSGTITLYLNGTKPVTGSGASSTSLTDQYLTIGTSIGNRDATATNHMNGYIDDFRITNGYARYTTNFTAPGGPFPTY